MTREDIQKIADKHCRMTAGWIFSYPEIEDFWNEAYEAGAAAERESCAMIDRGKCFWSQDGEGSDIWVAGCAQNRYFRINEGSPRENDMKYCFHCGKKLVEVQIEE